MTDYEKGIVAAMGHRDTPAKIDAFLAAQPEVWWCEEHTTSSKRSGFCVMYAYLVADEFPAELKECRMVKARLGPHDRPDRPGRPARLLGPIRRGAVGRPVAGVDLRRLLGGAMRHCFHCQGLIETWAFGWVHQDYWEEPHAARPCRWWRRCRVCLG